MSRRDNMKRIFVGNLPPDVRTRDLEDLFYKFGKIAFIDLKTRRGPPFAFVEFHDYRDAEEAVRCRDGKKWDGQRLRVEFPRGRERTSRFKNGSGSSRSSAPQRRSKYRVKVSGLPTSGSWQDLKDHMREVGEVCFADVFKGGEGVVEFVNYDDMRYAIRKLNNTKFKSHEGESSYIKLREDIASGDSRSRSRSPVASRRRATPSSRSRSPTGSRSPSSSPRSARASPRGPRDRPRSRSRSASESPRSNRASPRAARGRPRSRSRSASDSPPSARTPKREPRDRSKSHSRSPSGSPPSARTPKREPRDRSKSHSRSHSGSPPPARTIKRELRDRSKSHSRSPSGSPRSARGSSTKSNSRQII